MHTGAPARRLAVRPAPTSAAVERLIGPLRAAAASDLDRIGDPVLRARARHVISENARVVRADAIAGDLAAAGELMNASHRSLRDDYESSTPFVDEVWQRLVATPGVFGARITGAGWGGCLVALVVPERSISTSTTAALQAWMVQPAAGARLMP